MGGLKAIKKTEKTYATSPPNSASPSGFSTGNAIAFVIDCITQNSGRKPILSRYAQDHLSDRNFIYCGWASLVSSRTRRFFRTVAAGVVQLEAIEL